MQNFGGLQSAFGPGVTAEVSRQNYLRRKYPGMSLEDAETWDKDRRRRLTTNEISFARTIYGSVIRYNEVSIYSLKRVIPADNPHAPNGNIYFPLPEQYADDFWTSGNYWKRSLFIHEMCHVWQHQRGIKVPIRWFGELVSRKFDNDSGYIYAHLFKTPNLRYEQLHLEAQAEFMGDYYLVRTGQPRAIALINEKNRGFTRAQYEAKMPAALRKGGKDVPVA